ncbi:MAG: hypothetical protein ACE5DK_13250 [Paracoccaceae bacterium]
MKAKLLGFLPPFMIGFVVFAVALIAIDTLLMNMQGLSLIFHKS